MGKAELGIISGINGWLLLFCRSLAEEASEEGREEVLLREVRVVLFD